MKFVPSWAASFWRSAPKGFRFALIGVALTLVVLGLWHLWLVSEAFVLTLAGLGGAVAHRRRRPAATQARGTADRLERRWARWRRMVERRSGTKVVADAAAETVEVAELPKAGPRPRSRHLSGVLLVLLSATSCVAMQPAYADEAPCPTPTQATETLHLDAGCPAPWPGWLYTVGAHRGTVLDFLRLDRVVDRLKAALDDGNGELDDQRAACADDLADSHLEVDALAAQLKHAEPRASPWGWAIVGAAGAAVPYAGARWLGAGEGKAALAAGVSVLASALIAAWAG